LVCKQGAFDDQNGVAAFSSKVHSSKQNIIMIQYELERPGSLRALLLAAIEISIGD